MFRFTIRDVLWLTVVVAVGLAGMTYYIHAIEAAKQSERARRVEHEKWLHAQERAERLEVELMATTERLANQTGTTSEESN